MRGRESPGARGRAPLRHAWLPALCAAALLSLAGAPSAQALAEPLEPEVIAVNTMADFHEKEGSTHYCQRPERGEEGEVNSEECSLRAALEQADANILPPSPIREIVVQVPPGHYSIPKGTLPLGSSSLLQCKKLVPCAVTLRGAGAASTYIEGGGITEQLRVGEAVAGPVAVEDLTLRAGAAGIVDVTQKAPLTLRGVAVTGEKYPGWGPGLLLFDTAPAQVLVLDSAFTGNSGTEGGGIYLHKAGASIVRSTIAGNSAGRGGGIYAAEGSGEPETVHLLDSTVAGNSASEDGGGIWGSNFALLQDTVAGNSATINGGLSERGEIHLEGTILAGNSPSQCGYYEGPKPLKASGANVIAGGSGCVVEGAAPILADPRLSPLASNGGLGQTMALLAGSSAFDAGGASCPAAAFELEAAVDERGVARPQGAGCDIGAFESRTDAAVSLAASPEPSTVGGALSLTATAHNIGSEALSGVQVAIPLPAGTSVLAAPAGCAAKFGPGGSFTCSLGALGPGQSAAVTVQVRPEHAGALLESASVSSEQPDIKPADNTATIASVVNLPGPGGAGSGSGSGSVKGSALTGRSLRADRSGTITIALSCPEGAPGGCRDALDIFAAQGTLPAFASSRRAALLGSVRVLVPAGTTRRVRLRLSKAGLRLLPRGRRISARALLTARPGSGSGAAYTSRATVTLTRAR